MEGEKTILAKARSKSKSLRTTVPQSVVKQFGLEAGSSLIWRFESVKKRTLVVVVEK